MAKQGFRLRPLESQSVTVTLYWIYPRPCIHSQRPLVWSIFLHIIYLFKTFIACSNITGFQDRLQSCIRQCTCLSHTFFNMSYSCYTGLATAVKYFPQSAYNIFWTLLHARLWQVWKRIALFLVQENLVSIFVNVFSVLYVDLIYRNYKQHRGLFHLKSLTYLIMKTRREQIIGMD